MRNWIGLAAIIAVVGGCSAHQDLGTNDSNWGGKGRDGAPSSDGGASVDGAVFIDATPGNVCSPDDCAGQGIAGVACASGSGETVCAPKPSGGCAWKLICPADCSASDCAGLGTPGLACADGPGQTVCARNANGACAWKLNCPPAYQAADCAGLGIPEIGCANGSTPEFECIAGASGVCRFGSPRCGEDGGVAQP